MNVKSKRNRIFGACMLLMMTILAVCTVAFATGEGSDNGSYSLMIKKVFDFDLDPSLKIPEEVQKQVKNENYTFKIQGTYKKKQIVNGVEEWKDEKLEKTVTLPQKDDAGNNVWELEVYRGDTPYDVTVTELTDNIDVTDNNGRHYNMSNSSSDTKVLVSNRRHEIQMRDNSRLTIERPADLPDKDSPEVLWYHITNRPYDEHEKLTDTVDEVFSLRRGKRKDSQGFAPQFTLLSRLRLRMGIRSRWECGRRRLMPGKKVIFLSTVRLGY